MLPYGLGHVVALPYRDRIPRVVCEIEIEPVQRVLESQPVGVRQLELVILAIVTQGLPEGR